MKKLLLVLVSLIACAFAAGAPSPVAQSVNWAATTTAAEAQTITHEWKCNGVTVRVVTDRKAQESATNWLARHKTAVDAALAAFKPDAQSWWGMSKGGTVTTGTLVAQWFDSQGPRVTLTTERYAGEPIPVWTASHNGAVAVALSIFP